MGRKLLARFGALPVAVTTKLAGQSQPVATKKLTIKAKRKRHRKAGR